MRKPNLIVFLTDQQRADTIACDGSRKVYAPNLCKLASESVSFEHAYVTQPLCVPSRASLLTGMWPHQIAGGRKGISVDPQIRTLAGPIDIDGSNPAYWGKWRWGIEGMDSGGFADGIATEG